MTDNVAAPAAAPAAAPSAAPAAAPSAAPAVSQPWYSGFQDQDLRGYTETKGWKDPSEVVGSYRNLEKLVGVPPEQLLKLPKDETDKAGWDAVYKRMGRPDKPEDYKLPVLDGDNGEFAKNAAQWMNELGIPLKAAQALAGKNNEYLKKAMDGAQQVRTEQFANEHKALMREWGEAADKNSQVVDAVVEQLGIDGKALMALRDAMGPAGTMKFLYNIGVKLGEDRFVAGNGGGGFNGAMSPAAAKARIEALRGDPEFTKRYLEGGAAEKDELDKLHRMAYGA